MKSKKIKIRNFLANSIIVKKLKYKRITKKRGVADLS